VATINGTSGNDPLTGTAANDFIYGFEGDDTINGGAGADEIHAGAGNDTITDTSGQDYILAEDGDDHIIVTVTNGTGAIHGQAGSDTVDLTINGNARSYYVGLDEGNDLLNLHSMNVTAGMVRIGLGDGSDTVRFSSDYTPKTVEIYDFQEGAGGDVIDLAPFLSAWLPAHGISLPAGTDAFEAGYLSLTQEEGAAWLWFNPDGFKDGNSVKIAILDGVSLQDLVDANFAGLNFAAGVADNETRILDLSETILSGEIISVTDPQIYWGVLNYRPLYVFNGTGTFTNHGSIEVGGTAPGMAGYAVDFSVGDGAFVNGADGSFVVRNLSTDPNTAHVYGVLFPGNVAVDVSNAGYFEVSADTGLAFGIDFERTVNEITTIDNSGTFVVTSGGSAYGLVYGGSFSVVDFTNSGDFTVTGTAEAHGIYEYSPGIFTNTGSITVTSDTYAIAVEFGLASGLPFSNAGTITAITDPSSPYASIGVYISETLEPPGDAYHFDNSGTITADIAFWIENDHSTFVLANDYLDNSGTINGAIILSFGDDVLENSGTVNGIVLLGDGDDRYEGAAGRHTGYVAGGTGNDWIIGGQLGENLYGDQGNDTISGGGGQDFIEGGMGADTLDGGAGQDLLSYGESLAAVTIDLLAGTANDGLNQDALRSFEQVLGSRFADQILGSDAANTVYGNDGDDVIDGRGGNDVLIAGHGNDDLTGGAGNDKFQFSVGDGSDTIRDFTLGDKVQVYGYTSATSIQQVGANVVITLSATDTITLLGTSLANVQSALYFYSKPLAGIAPVTDQTIIVTGEDFNLGAGATVTLTDPASFDYRQTTFSGYGVLLSTIGNGPAPNFFNAGTYDLSASTGAPLVGVGCTYNGYWDDNFHFVNQATGQIVIANLVGDAVGVSGISNVFNLGTMTVASNGGDAYGFTDLPPFVGIERDSHFVNSGTVSVQAAGHAVGLGLYYGSSDSVDRVYNSGELNIHGGDSSIGLTWISRTHPASPENNFITNSGTITVTDDTAASDSAGISVDWTGTVDIWNSGTIQADYAILRDFGFTGGDGTLSIYNSGNLIGDVDLLFTEFAGDTRNVRLINTGSIDGEVKLTDGNDLFDSRIGSVSGPVSGNAGADQLLAGLGAQSLSGGDGNDLLSGGRGNDILTGGAGADVFRYETNFGIDMISDFDPATDHIEIRGYASWQSVVQQGANVVVTFAAGNQLIFLNQLVANITPSLFTFGAAAIPANAIPVAPVAPGPPTTPEVAVPDAIFPVYGSSSANTLTGTSGRDALFGLAGSDVLNGAAADDRLEGGLGNDQLNGGLGADRMVGGAGNDTYFVDNAGDTLTENPGEGTDLVQSSISITLADNFENLTLTGSAVTGTGNALANVITGNNVANALFGLDGNDTLSGGAGGDTLDGGIGIDKLYGGTGNDILIGGDDLDVLDGGAGRDTFTGGAGADRFTFHDGDFAGLTAATADEITDFSHADHDRIFLDGIDANTANGSGTNDAFSFIGTAGFHNVAGELRYEQISGNTYVYGDTNGDGVADFMMRLDGSHALVTGDFVL
jgi:Ca2+-binding RTX toxin-like protein